MQPELPPLYFDDPIHARGYEWFRQEMNLLPSGEEGVRQLSEEFRELISDPVKAMALFRTLAGLRCQMQLLKSKEYSDKVADVVGLLSFCVTQLDKLQ